MYAQIWHEIIICHIFKIFQFDSSLLISFHFLIMNSIRTINSNDINDQKCNFDFLKIFSNLKSKLEELPKSTPNLVDIILIGGMLNGKSLFLDCRTEKQYRYLDEEEDFEFHSKEKYEIKEPTITFFEYEAIILYELPTINKYNEFPQEIINSFFLNSLKKTRYNDKFKILLAVPSYDSEISDRYDYTQTFLQLREVFSNKIEHSVGLVTSRDRRDFDDYNKYMNMECNQINNVLNKCEQESFDFRRFQRDNRNKLIEFNDKYQLIDFIKKDLIIHPDFKASLKQYSLHVIDDVNYNRSKMVLRKIQLIWTKIRCEFIKEEISDEILKFISKMHEILKQKYSCADDFVTIIKKCFPNNQQYEEDLKSLNEFELIDSFFTKVLKFNRGQQLLTDEIHDLSQQAIIELEALLVKKIKEETLEQIKKEDENKAKELKQMLNDQNELFIVQQKTIMTLQQTIAQQSQEINNLMHKK